MRDYRDTLLIADGDWRAEFLRRGWPAGQPIERANLDRPDTVRDIADAFIDAGAEVLVTNTFAAHSLGFQSGAEADMDAHLDFGAMNRRGVEICRAAAAECPNRKLIILGAMGSLQRLLLLGEVNERSVTEAYRAQALALAESGVDGLICRRFREMEALRLAARAAATTQLPLVACMTFDCGAEFMETSMGASVAQACEILREVGAAVIGCDGGENPDALPALVAEMQKHWQGPIWASTDAGTPLLTDGKLTYSDKPANFAARLPALRAAGANFVGGGRGATTDHIAALAAAGKSRK